MADQDHRHDIKIPRSVLIGAAIVIAGTILAVALFRASGAEPFARVPEPAQVVEQRELIFADGAGGTVVVHEYQNGEIGALLKVIEPGEGGFIRGVLRSLARARRAGGVSNEYPFRLIEQANGILLLEDPMTGERIDLQAFGPAGVESFKALLARDDLS